MDGEDFLVEEQIFHDRGHVPEVRGHEQRGGSHHPASAKRSTFSAWYRHLCCEQSQAWTVLNGAPHRELRAVLVVRLPGAVGARLGLQHLVGAAALPARVNEVEIVPGAA